jgi:SAM-dependent methyltransferase
MWSSRASLESVQRLEVEYWRDSPDEAPGSFSVQNMLNKMTDASVLSDLFSLYSSQLETEGRVLEIGAGQGWASCYYKRQFPTAHLTATDLSAYAIASTKYWEDIWKVELGNKYSCPSYRTQEEDSSTDVVFCFAAAHHFVLHEDTLKEIRRVLRPGGRAFYFFEPATSALCYRWAYRRVNRKRPHVPEDVLVTARILEAARGLGLSAVADAFPSITKRGPTETMYYSALRRLGPLQKILPCTTNFRFSKH